MSLPSFGGRPDQVVKTGLALGTGLAVTAAHTGAGAAVIGAGTTAAAAAGPVIVALAPILVPAVAVWALWKWIND